jgi:hypothetical protein
MLRTIALVLGLCLGAPTLVAAQDARVAARALLDSLRPEIESAVSQAAWPRIDAAIVRLRTAIATPFGRADQWAHYDLAYALHRRASALIVLDSGRTARPLLEEAVRMSQRAHELGAGPTALALEGAVTGQLAGVGGGFAPMRFGPRAFRLLDQAVTEAPNDPRVALLNGITRFNAPRAFGGGPTKGEAELRRAVRLFETDRAASPQPIWGRPDAHLWLGLALVALNRPGDARVEYQRVLQMAPGHKWVTERLLPELDPTR